MEIQIRELTSPELVRECARFTRRLSTDDLDEMTPHAFGKFVRSEHSPLRAYMLLIKIFDIPYWVAGHLVRHQVGEVPFDSESFITTSRTDITHKRERSPEDRVNLALLINAQGLIDMSKKRLCFGAAPETVQVWQAVKNALHDHGNPYTEILANQLQPTCLYRGGQCNELKWCGREGTHHVNF
jgi:hypothetical protein